MDLKSTFENVEGLFRELNQDFNIITVSEHLAQVS